MPLIKEGLTHMERLPNKNLFRVDEVADYFGVAGSTVYGWIATGRLDAVKVAGTVLRVPREAIEKAQQAAVE